LVASWEDGAAEISSQFDQHTAAIEAGERDTGEGEITIHDVRFSMDGDLLAIIDRREWVTIWHLASLEQLASLPLSDLPGPFTLSHDGTKLILRDGDRGRVRDLLNGAHEVTSVPSSVIAEVQVFMRSSSPADRSRQSPNGRFFIDHSSDGTTRIKDRQTGRAIANLGGSLNYPVEAAFSPDGLRIAVASADSRVVRVHHWEEYAPEEELVEVARHLISR
jgi:WD40 repeat protein